MTALFVPGTEETDQKKQNQSLQLLGGAISTNTTDIATNTAAIATLTATLAALAAPLRNSLGADVALNNTANYFDGPSVAQGTSGTWFASGNVTLTDPVTGAFMYCKLWDGTTVIDSGSVHLTVAQTRVVSLSGFIASPAGNLRISCRDISATTGKILFNDTGNSKDSTITAIRIA